MNSGLKYRHEHKYYINFHQYLILRQRLKHLMKIDQNAGSAGEYHIRSLYFDDINNKALDEKLAGIRDRVKYRIRIYNFEDTVIHLEKKIKYKDFIAKEKEKIPKQMVKSLLAGNYEALNNPQKPLLYEVYYGMKNKLLRPRVIVDYLREPYVAQTGNVRITFDKNLKTGLHAVDIFNKQLQTVHAIDENFIIIEVKYDEYIPEYVKIALQIEGLRRQSISKYVLCRKYTKANSWEDQ